MREDLYYPASPDADAEESKYGPRDMSKTDLKYTTHNNL